MLIPEARPGEILPVGTICRIPNGEAVDVRFGSSPMANGQALNVEPAAGKSPAMGLSTPAPAWLPQQGTATLRPGGSRSIHLESLLTIPDGMKIKEDHLSIPGLGLVRLRRHGGNPYPEDKPVKASVVHECGKWYATVCYKVELPPRVEPELTAAMDRNCGQVAVVYSDGTREIHRQPDTRLLQIRLKRARRKLAGQQKGSRRRHRTRSRLQKLHRRIRAAANTWRHRLTRNIADKAGLLVLEKLDIQGNPNSG